MPPTVLTIAGSDCSGGAGIQADLKTFTAHGCYGASAITALVAENTVGVQDVHPSPPDFLRQQILSTIQDIAMDAIKTGMLFDAALTRVVVDTLKEHYGNGLPPLVCDPVCVATSGHSLLNPDAIEVMITQLFPLASLITPNKSEVELLLSHGRSKAYPVINTLTDMLTACKESLVLGPKAVLLKGGHLTATIEDVEKLSASHPEVTVFYDGPFGENMEILYVGRNKLAVEVVVDMMQETGQDSVTLFIRPRLDSTSTHGTGCTLSAAIASGLSAGLDLQTAVRNATVYTHVGIETASSLGAGHGPLNHMHAITHLAIPIPTETNSHPFVRRLIQDDSIMWKAYVQHDFVVQLAQGILKKDSFLHFIKQDYHYLKYYARAYGLLAAKSTTFPAIGTATQTILNILAEIKNHKAFCDKFGVSVEELENTPESPACTAYGAYLLDVGLQGDRTKLLMALLACLLGYGEVGLWVKRLAASGQRNFVLDGNPYLPWIEDYSGDWYQGAVKMGLELIEQCAVEDPPSPTKYREWRDVWQRCTRLEKGFWDMAMNLS